MQHGDDGHRSSAPCSFTQGAPMLVIEDQKYFDEVVAFAKARGLYEPKDAGPRDGAHYLRSTLDRLERFIRQSEDGELLTRVVLYPDFAPRSFGFSVQRRDDRGAWTAGLTGGVIFHGPHDGGGNGGAPTFSGSLTPTVGWATHT
jgi:hypothetical protein